MCAPGPLLLLLAATTASIDAVIYHVEEPIEWWQNTVLYQTWPRSGKDSDGNGIGDLKGITSILGHFVDMGVGAMWLSPIYVSPMHDTGYDISNFIDILPEFGTLEDFDELIATAHALGIKVLLDFVPNHSSDEHEWFQKAKAGIEPYKDYYIWNEGKMVNGTRQPPSNWLTASNVGSAWEWVEERQAYYFHQFSPKQPDLNYRNPRVIQESKDILTFWLNRGVDGFRVDSVNYLVEDESPRDEPPSGLPGYGPGDFYSLDHIYTKDRQENFGIVRIWSDHIKDWAKNNNHPVSIPLFTEAYANISIVTEYFRYGAEVPFNFYAIKDEDGINVIHYDTAHQVVGNITLWMTNMPKGATANWVYSNHDNSRVATRYGQQYVDIFNVMLYSLPGTATTYYGDEIGMIDGDLSWEQTVDPAACDTNRTTYSSVSRDPERTPFQWDDTTSAGFSTNSTPYLPVNEDYRQLNLAAQKEADVSYYKNVQALIKLRKNPVMEKGNLDIRVVKDQVIVFTRNLDGHKPIVVLINWSETKVEISLKDFSNVPNRLKVLIAGTNSGIKIGSLYKKTKIELPGYAAVVLEEYKNENIFQKSAKRLFSFFG